MPNPFDIATDGYKSNQMAIATNGYISGGGGGTIYYMAIAGALAMSGDITKSIYIMLGGDIQFTAAVVRLITLQVLASLTFSSVVSSATAFVRSILSTIDFSSNVSRATSKGISANVGFTGLLNKFVSMTRLGMVSFAGLATKTAYVILVASITFAASLALLVGKVLSSYVSFSASLIRYIYKSLASSMSFASSITRAVGKVLLSSLDFVGDGIARLLMKYTQAVDGALDLYGDITKYVSLRLESYVSFLSTVRVAISKNLASSVSFVGLASKITSRALVSALSFIGRVGRLFNFRRSKPVVKTRTQFDDVVAETRPDSTVSVKTVVSEATDISTSQVNSTSVKTGTDTIVVLPVVEGDE